MGHPLGAHEAISRALGFPKTREGTPFGCPLEFPDREAVGYRLADRSRAKDVLERSSSR